MDKDNELELKNVLYETKIYCEMEYEIHGKGEHKIVLIPGLMTDKALWKYQVEHILQNEKDCEILAINNYGMKQRDISD